MLFLQIFHPNVHFRTGDICLDILKKEWSPAWGLQAACRAVLALVCTVVSPQWLYIILSSLCSHARAKHVPSLYLSLHAPLHLYNQFIKQLSDPDAESPLNCDAGNMIRGGDQIAFYTTAAMYTVENAFFTSWPPIDEHEEK